MSNFHPPEIIDDGLMRKKRASDGSREQEQSQVPCPIQQQYYSETFHLIDKGNGAEACYDISVESHTHGWSPKLAFRYFNMNLNNAYKIYDFLVGKYTPNRRYLDMPECVELATHNFLQRGESMRERKPDHPLPIRDLTTIFDTGSGKKMRKDAQGDRGGYGRVRNESRVIIHSKITEKTKEKPLVYEPISRVQEKGKVLFCRLP